MRHMLMVMILGGWVWCGLCVAQEHPSVKMPRISLEQSDKDFLLDLARKTISDAITNREVTTPSPPPVPATTTKELSRVVAVSLCSRGRLLQTATAQEDSLANSVRKAAWRLGEMIRPFQDAADALKNGRILIEIVGDKTRIQTVFPRDALRAINIGLEGIEVNVKGTGAYVPPLNILVNLAQNQSLVEPLYTLAGLSKDVKTPADVHFYRFPALTFIESSPGGYPLDLYRGNVLISKVDTEDLETAAFAGGRWLLKMLDNSGRFKYWFHPMTGIHEMRYDMLHHAAACLAFLQLYEQTRDEGFMVAFKRGLGYLMRHMKQIKRGDRRIAYVQVGDDAPLGVAALTLLLLAEYSRISGEKPEAQVMDDLGAFIVQMQADTGAFYRLLSHAEKKAFPAEEQQTFYAGQAIYALARATKLLPHDEWAEAAIKGAGFQVKEFSRTANPDPWVIRGLAAVFEMTNDDTLATAALQMADVILAHQLKPGSVPDLDFIGGFDDNNPPRTVSAARFAQGLCVAHALAQKLNKPTDRYREGIILAMKFVLQQQLRPENSFFIVNIPDALGAFHQSPMTFDLRIDYTQNAVVAAMAAANVLRGK